MTKIHYFLLLSVCMSATAFTQAMAQTTLDVETTIIKGNTELPKFLYVVPWQEKSNHHSATQKVVIHNIYGDLFDPVLPERIAQEPLSANAKQ
jgi:hypothetical protein